MLCVIIVLYVYVPIYWVHIGREVIPFTQFSQHKDVSDQLKTYRVRNIIYRNVLALYWASGMESRSEQWSTWTDKRV